MRRMMWVLVLGACSSAPKPAAPVENAQTLSVERLLALPHVTYAARPDIDVSQYIPDLHDELRWPLSLMMHPKLEPSFAIATALAAPGVGWVDLCAMGAQNRHLSGDPDLVAYLRGWCSVAKDDVDHACGYFSPLLGSVTHGISDAVRTDLANILVQRDSEDAEHWLNRHKLRDIALLDQLTANFVEVGKLEDAVAMNRRVIDSDKAPTAATKCHRLVRQIALLGKQDFPAIEELTDIATQPKAPDETCVRLHHMVKCWTEPGDACAEYAHDQGWDPHVVSMLGLYWAWPTGEHDYPTWVRLGERAVGVVQIEGAAELAVTAFEAALRADSRCDAGTKRDIATLAKSAPPRLRPRIEALDARCPIKL